MATEGLYRRGIRAGPRQRGRGQREPGGVIRIANDSVYVLQAMCYRHGPSGREFGEYGFEAFLQPKTVSVG